MIKVCRTLLMQSVKWQLEVHCPRFPTVAPTGDIHRVDGGCGLSVHSRSFLPLISQCTQLSHEPVLRIVDRFWTSLLDHQEYTNQSCKSSASQRDELSAVTNKHPLSDCTGRDKSPCKKQQHNGHLSPAMLSLSILTMLCALLLMLFF